MTEAGHAQEASDFSATMARLRLVLAVAAAFAAAASAALVFLFALSDADDRLVTALEGKATAHARVIKEDVEIALGLGIPLNEIPGAYEYLEEGANQDPDVRFAVLTDLELNRIHYGGIGRRRLDPLLDTPDLKEALEASVAASVRSTGGGAIGILSRGFAMTALPLEADGHEVGFVVVAVQAKQVREALGSDFASLLPLALAVLLLLADLALAAARQSIEEPLERLARLMRSFGRDTRLERSGRHDRTELGIALLRFNGIAFRLAERAQRVMDLAGEVQRAVFDPEVATQVRDRAKALRETVALAVVEPPRVSARARSSDLHMSVTLILTASALGLGAIAVTGSPWDLAAGLAGLLAGGLVARRLRSAGWSLVLGGVSVLAAVPLLRLPEAEEPVSASAAACLGAAVALICLGGRYYLRGTRLSPSLWVLGRLFFGGLSGLLAVWSLALEDRLDLTAATMVVAVALAVLSANREQIVRRRLFTRADRSRAG